MFEHRHQRLLPFKAYLHRQLNFALVAFSIILVSLIIGILGYHFFEGLGWIESLLNSAMILGGMGPVDTLKTTGGKIFASVFALYSGVVFLIVAGVLFAPIFHRILHHFHMEMESDSEEPK